MSMEEPNYRLANSALGLARCSSQWSTCEDSPTAITVQSICFPRL